MATWSWCTCQTRWDLRADNERDLCTLESIRWARRRGFELHGREGQRVRAGDMLVSFDAGLWRGGKEPRHRFIPHGHHGFLYFPPQREVSCSGGFMMGSCRAEDIAHAGLVSRVGLRRWDEARRFAKGGVGGRARGVTAASDVL